MDNLEIKPGAGLSLEEINQINQAKLEEFKVPEMSQKQIQNSIFFLLKSNSGRILATGQLVDIGQTRFNGEEFNLLGVGGIIASQKGEGLGAKIMKAIRNYLIENDKTGVGFTSNTTNIFYEKCGFNWDEKSLKRFVYYYENQKKSNRNDKFVIYFDSTDKFMEKVLANPDKEVLLSREPNW